MLFDSGGNISEIFDLTEETLNEVAVAISHALKAGTFTRLGMGLILAQALRAAIPARCQGVSRRVRPRCRHLSENFTLDIGLGTKPQY